MPMACYCSCLVLVLVVAIVSCAPRVKLLRSTFVGFDLETSENRTPYHAYYAIPFAEPPVGNLRFRAPVAYNFTRRQTFHSKTFKLGCVQQSRFFSIYHSQEDCLYLNVFTPSVGKATRFDSTPVKKVIVFIHGGSFFAGDTASHIPSNMVADYDVIVVTVAYRLGILGFLSSGDDVLPGNLGLLDQLTALNWVKDNIRRFGGDPSDLTVYGSSAGAVSASLLSISPLAKGLFSKVIIESGSPLAPWAIYKKSKSTFYVLAERANCIPVDTNNRTTTREYQSRIVDCLRNADAHQLEVLMNAEMTARPDNALCMAGISFLLPVVDGVVIPRDPFELLNDVDYLRSVGTLDRKYLVGIANNEAIPFLPNILASMPMESLLNPDSPGAKAAIDYNFRWVFSSPTTPMILHIVSFLYYYPRNVTGYSSLQSSADFFSDIDYVVPAVKFVRALTKASEDGIVYLYLFDYYPPLTDPGSQIEGSAHGMTVMLAMDDGTKLTKSIDYANISSESRTFLANTCRRMITNMAKKGNPSFSETIQWPPYDRTNEFYMAISETPEVRQHVYARRVAMWVDLLPKVLSESYLYVSP